MIEHKKIALVHDWLLGLGGAERVLKVWHEMFPEAPIYTLFQNKKFTGQFLPKAEIRTSSLQKFYNFASHKLLTPFLPLAVESWDMSEFDLVISSSVAFSKGLILKPKTKHLCYCYSPTRFLWDWSNEYLKTIGGGRWTVNWPIRIIQHLLRIWDRQASTRVDHFVAISKNVQQRIKKYYQRDSTVIYPPCPSFPSSSFSSDRWKMTTKEDYRLPTTDYFLIVSRLFAHKNIDIAVETFNKLKRPLVIVGDGPEYKRLKALVDDPAQIKLTGHVQDKDLPSYYLHAKAFILPQEEDFGLAPLEAMSFGKPVLALRKGGALEYILEGINGEWFDDPHPAILADGVRRLNENLANYNPSVIRKTAERFSRERFEREIRALVAKT